MRVINITEAIDRSKKQIVTVDVHLDTKTVSQILSGAEIFFDGFCWEYVTGIVEVGTQTLTFKKV